MRPERFVVFVAGGQASRLRGHASSMPKALQTVAGVPLLDRLISEATRLGFGRFHFALNHLHESILEHLSVRGTDFTWSLDDIPGGSGTAGALRSAQDQLPEEFVVWLADTLPPPDLHSPLLLPPEAPTIARMAVSAQVPDVPPNVAVQGGRIVGYDKQTSAGATHVDAGLYAMTGDIFDYVPGNGRCDLEQLWPKLAQLGCLEAEVVTGRFLDIGTPARLAVADRVFRTVGHDA
ncbi:nucleotidyltransferase family protein [Rhodococcus pyridinivorans]|uniref:NTP transferase domain-containing protein n=1 Tax=Rhodococcus pyridinivorans TaxID=103816 RepID=A0A7M2XWW8_9NOCA|nr:NTP transferase domain-containing protein [Rhodococcus pyridinivorans]QOW01843.1 NTP transferase domain-containing protein [Rhodococcus pyridinivorans]